MVGCQNKWIAICVMLLCNCSCTLNKKWSNERQWNKTGVYQVVLSKTGEGAQNCGFHNIIFRAGRQERWSGLRCMRKAMARGQAFYFGTYRIPVDSFLMEIVFTTPNGEVWSIDYDRMFDDPNSVVYVEQCGSLKFVRFGSDFRLVDCEKRPVDDWL